MTNDQSRLSRSLGRLCEGLGARCLCPDPRPLIPDPRFVAVLLPNLGHELIALLLCLFHFALVPFGPVESLFGGGDLCQAPEPLPALLTVEFGLDFQLSLGAFERSPGQARLLPAPENLLGGLGTGAQQVL